MNLKEKNFKKIYRAWKYNLRVFEPFMRSGPFVSLQTYPNFKFTYLLNESYLYNMYKDKLMSITKNNFKKTFVIIDTDMNTDLEMAYLLNNKFNIKPIINFNFLFHPYGLVGSKSSIERLILLGENLTAINPIGYVLFLDYNRFNDFSETFYKKKLNNQYEFSPEDLPYADTLKNIGYTNLTIYTQNPIKEDIKFYLDTLKNNLNIEIVTWG